MEDLSNSYLVGDFIKTLRADITTATPNTNYGCCPLIAYTSGRNTVLARFAGQIGIKNLQDLKSVFSQLLSNNVVKIIADLENATISKAALGELVAFVATCFGMQKRFYLYNPSDAIMRTLQESNLSEYFSYLKSHDDIIATLKV